MHLSGSILKQNTTRDSRTRAAWCVQQACPHGQHLPVSCASDSQRQGRSEDWVWSQNRCQRGERFCLHWPSQLGCLQRRCKPDASNIRLQVPYRCNQKDYKPTNAAFASARKRIETVYSQLDDQFILVRNYAKHMMSIFARTTAKMSALTMLQYINFINNKPIGKVKSALI